MGDTYNKEDEYGSFEEKGYKVIALMPDRYTDPTHFLVQVYKPNTSEPFKEIRVDMEHSPRFGVDSEDVARLENEVDKLMNELPHLTNIKLNI